MSAPRSMPGRERTPQVRAAPQVSRGSARDARGAPRSGRSSGAVIGEPGPVCALCRTRLELRAHAVHGSALGGRPARRRLAHRQSPRRGKAALSREAARSVSERARHRLRQQRLGSGAPACAPIGRCSSTPVRRRAGSRIALGSRPRIGNEVQFVQQMGRSTGLLRYAKTQARTTRPGRIPSKSALPTSPRSTGSYRGARCSPAERVLRRSARSRRRPLGRRPRVRPADATRGQRRRRRRTGRTHLHAQRRLERHRGPELLPGHHHLQQLLRVRHRQVGSRRERAEIPHPAPGPSRSAARRK